MNQNQREMLIKALLDDDEEVRRIVRTRVLEEIRKALLYLGDVSIAWKNQERYIRCESLQKRFEELKEKWK